MVLEPKNALSDLPPLIVEIQHTINIAFMKRAVNYCIQTYTRYDCKPIILIICVEKLHQDIYKHVKPSTLPGVFSYFSQPWAEHCYIISKESIQENMTTSLNPLIALVSFFINRNLSITNRPFKNDPTIQYLYTSALFQHQIDTINKDIPLTLIDLQLMEYDRLITLANTFGQPLLGEAANDAKSRTLTIKRKYENSFTAKPSSSKKKKNMSVSSPTSSTATATVDRNNNMYEAAMIFVVEFKQKKVEGGKRMD